ncbi:hypothetical protein N7534_001384 [Penicillium rubens]|nr:hypothetical protein N7534_001384 [Penicillium rubens]
MSLRDNKNEVLPGRSEAIQETNSKHNHGWRRIVRNFTPAWFSVNMGTGITSILLNTLPYNGRWLYWISVVIFALNVLLFIIFLTITILRYVLYPKIFYLMVTHPTQSLFLGTFPMGLATIINMICYVCVPAWGAWTVYFAWGLWIADVVVSVMTCFGMPFIMMTQMADIELQTMGAAWLLPIVSCVVAAASGGIMADILPNAQYALGTIIVSYVLWGIGVPLAMMVVVIYLMRLMLYKLPAKAVIVSTFLPLGPLGQGGFGIQKLGMAAQKVFPLTGTLRSGSGDTLYDIGFLIGLLLWSFGCLWLFFAVAAIIRSKKFPFNLGWWAFTFPLGVFTTCTNQLGREIPSRFFRVLGTILSVCVLLLWILVSLFTLKGVFNRSLFVAPCLGDLQESAIDPQNKEAGYYNLGTYHRPINTTVSDAQLWFDRGLQWSYSFNHEEGARCFKTAAESDPNCAMAYWGLAYALGPNYNKAWSRFDQGDLDETVETASVALKLAQELSQKAEKAPIEYALIKALAARFPVKGMPLDLNALNHAYVNEMRSVYTLSPEDPDVVALFTEALMCTRPRDLWNVKTGEPAGCTVEARQALEPAMARKGGMEHPAFCHLYIHLMEMSPWPEIALKAADSLRRVVPDGSHLLHMASHIDIACGDYRGALIANDAAILADNKFFAREHSSVMYTMYRAHNAYAKSYAAIMLGNFTEALSAARVVGEILTPSLLSVASPPLADWAEAYLGVLPHVLVRFGRWDDILQLDLPEDKTLLCSTSAMVYYAKGIALSVLGRIEEAQQILLQFRAAHAAVPASRLGSLPSREIDVLQVAAAMLQGELEYRKGHYSLAFSSLRKAVELEDALPYADPPAWIQPSRHALGALLLEQNHVAEAEIVFREDLGLKPGFPRRRARLNNVWGLHGLYECFVRSGKEPQALFIRTQRDLAMASADIPVTASCFCRLSDSVDEAGCCRQ